MVPHEAAELLDVLDSIASLRVRQVCMTLLLVMVAGGLAVRVRRAGGERELQFRDADGSQPCTALLADTSLLFCLRRPLLDLQPGLAIAAIQRFADRLASDPASTSEVRVRLNDIADVEDLVDFLRLRPRLVSLGYGGRKSA
jgi:hypothetical protein